MPKTWENALRAYWYPVNLNAFADARCYPGWSNYNLETGDRRATVQFEDRFRTHAPKAIESWYEVVFWKMFSQRGRSDAKTRDVIGKLQRRAISARTLWQACSEYVKRPSRSAFESFRKLFGFETSAIAVVATFPAFLDPEHFPMVDTRTARWVRDSFEKHNAVDPSGPQLVLPRFPGNGRSVLTMDDWAFVEAWTAWCGHTAGKLQGSSRVEWRARDVEMAVFQAWGERGKPHPVRPLNPLPPRRQTEGSERWTV